MPDQVKSCEEADAKDSTTSAVVVESKPTVPPPLPLSTDIQKGEKPTVTSSAKTTVDGCIKSKQSSITTIVKYGELVILGYNGFLPQGERGRRRSKFILYKRATANGVKRSRHYAVKTPQASKAILDTKQHSISYTLSRTQAIIVEYALDANTDMFQVGRSSEPPIDFVVMDTLSSYASSKSVGGAAASVAVAPTQSTISRFACRIICDRNEPSTARIYAAGFDTSCNIFLGEKATKWQSEGEIDGLTTNGILIMHPKGTFCGGSSATGAWTEVSVGGGVYTLRESRSAPEKGNVVHDETNALQDGTLIDLCGATLLFRSSEGLAKSPTKLHLEQQIDDLNAGRPQCPVGLNTLVIPRKCVTGSGNIVSNGGGSGSSETDKQPYVYLVCGHVQGHHEWGHEEGSDVRTCPMCLVAGPTVKLAMGIEPSFYVDCGSPTYAFSPCGHMATEKTVKYWASVPIPHGTNGFHAACPFCAVPLDSYPNSGYVKLIFQDNLD